MIIESLLPRPIGSDAVNEQVTLKNRGSVTLSMAGWVLRDDNGKIWKLSSLGDLNPGESKTIRRNGMAMRLKDGGDTVSLISPDGAKKDEFQYQSSQEGVLISTGH